MTTVRWWHRPTRMASAAQFGWFILFGFGLFSAVMMVVVGYEYSLLKRIVIINLLCVLLNTFVDLVSSCVTYRNSLSRNTSS